MNTFTTTKPRLKRIASRSALFLLLSGTLLPAIGQAAGYKFSSFQYPGAFGTVFAGVDDTGRITGYANFASYTQAIFITAAGSLAQVNVPGAVSAFPAAINRLGGIVGTAYDGVNYFQFQDSVDGFGPISLELIDQSVSGINSSFNIVGNFTNASLQNSAYVRLNGTYYPLLQAQRCAYTHDPAINDSNVVAGNCVTPSNASLIFTWFKGAYTYFQPPPGFSYVQVSGINKAGVIVGYYIDPNGFSHGFVLSGGVYTTVDYPAAGASNTKILGVNSAGKIVGSYMAPADTAWIGTPQ